MGVTREYSTGSLILRAARPTVLSVLVCALVAAGFIILHFILLSINQGAFLPNLFDGDWAAFYSNSVTRPLLLITQNDVVNQIIAALLWGILGVIVYAIITFISRRISWFRSEQSAMRMDGGQAFKYHTPIVSVVGRAIFRFAVLVVGVLFSMLVGPFFSSRFSQHTSIFDGLVPATEAAMTIALTVILVAVSLQIYLALLRLFLLRTKIFGEVIY